MLPEVEETEGSKLDEAIDRLLEQMSSTDCTTKDYAFMADQLTKLYRMKDLEETLRLKRLDSLSKQKEADANAALRLAETALKRRDLENPRRVSPDTLVLVAGNLIGIVIILGYEKANVITSRAINFVMKLR